jgi:CoA:oxalate CoA-transferase
MGDLTIPGFPLRFSEQPERLDLVAPTLGQHNSEVLSGVLGYTRDRITDLENDGVLVSRDR